MIKRLKAGKQLCSLFLSLCLLCSLFMTVQVEAAETLANGDWRYGILEDGTVEIRGYNGKETEIVIPGMIDEKSVTRIGTEAFICCIDLSSITIPTGVTSIGMSAFEGCRNLSSITIPASVTSIGERAFTGCGSLSNITIPTGVTSIGRYAFFDCGGLSSITIPASVTSIGTGIFSACSSLTSINVAENSQSYTSKDGVLYDKSCETIICCPYGKQGTITIPASVTSIGERAFAGCRSLSGITIPASVTSIGESAFESCSSLSSITIPDSVTSIGWHAFSDCSSLSSITIPGSVTSIGESAFSDCSSLTDINVAENSKSYASKDGVLYNKSYKTLICCPLGKQETITIPDSVTSIGRYAFAGCRSLSSITIPDSVTSIGGYAFFGCRSLSSITIPGSVTSIGIYAFSVCNNLSSISIPNSVTNIGNSAFSGCSSLSSISIPNSVTKIGSDVFYGCSSDLTIYGESGFYAEQYAKEEGIKFSTSEMPLPHIHTIVQDPAIAPTCKKDGRTVGSHCSDCGKVIQEQEVIPATGHTVVADPAIAPTCTKDGRTAGSHCSVCGEALEVQEIIPTTGHTVVTIPATDSTCTEAGKTEGSYCTVCGEVIQKQEVVPASHTIETVPAIAPTCTKAGKTEGSYCTVCGEVIQKQEVVPARHTIVTDPAIAPTCTKPGKTKGSHCSICNELIKAQEDIPATGHRYQLIIQKATAKKNGAIINKCSACGDVKSTTEIYAASGIKLSKTSFTYNRKNRKPTVTIKDNKGNKLSASSYKITRPKTSKKVGKYTITITLQGNYSGTVKLTYQIAPKTTSISKLTAKKKGLTVKWKKQTGQTTGYQLQYSTSKKFKGAKTVTVKKNKTISKSVKKLKAGKKYYVRIRTYKTVKVNGKSVKLCSSWSKVKSVKTKK